MLWAFKFLSVFTVHVGRLRRCQKQAGVPEPWLLKHSLAVQLTMKAFVFPIKIFPLYLLTHFVPRIYIYF